MSPGTQSVWKNEFHLWPNTALISSVKRLGWSRLKTNDVCRVNDCTVTAGGALSAVIDLWFVYLLSGPFLPWIYNLINALSRVVTFVLLFYELNPHFMLCHAVCRAFTSLPNQDVNCRPLNMSSGSFSKATEAERCCINPSPTASSLSGITVGDRLHPWKDTGDTMDKSTAHGKHIDTNS